jgi:DNA invertase Pin-like site-specific DNA recombinase
VAEGEACITSARMQAALAAAKARGARLGNSHLRPGTFEQAFAPNRVAAKIITSKARRYAADMAPVIRLTRAEGVTSLAAIAAARTALGVLSPSGRGGWLVTTTLNPPPVTNRQQGQ